MGDTRPESYLLIAYKLICHIAYWPPIVVGTYFSNVISDGEWLFTSFWSPESSYGRGWRTFRGWSLREYWVSRSGKTRLVWSLREDLPFSSFYLEDPSIKLSPILQSAGGFLLEGINRIWGRNTRARLSHTREAHVDLLLRPMRKRWKEGPTVLVRIGQGEKEKLYSCSCSWDNQPNLNTLDRFCIAYPYLSRLRKTLLTTERKYPAISTDFVSPLPIQFFLPLRVKR